MATLSPLISAAELERRLGRVSLRIADCRFYLAEPDRGAAEYVGGHIPGARYFSLDDDLTATRGPGRHPLPDAGVFAGLVGAAGIGNEHDVIAYDNAGGGIAARLWWMLRSLGHTRVQVLDGGWEAWNATSRPISTSVPRWDPALFSGASEWTGIITAEQIEADNTGLLLVDARASERYRGDDEPIDPVAGHIPGAVNIPYQGNVAAGGLFLSRADLEERYAATIDSPLTTVSYCGSGVTACNNLLALAVIGHTDALLYPGSWSDWCQRPG